MSTSATLTDLTQAVVNSNVTVLQGQVVTRPALLVSDGTNTTYACDVDVAMPTLDGKYDQTTLDLTGVPGTDHYVVDDSITTGTILRNVPVANNNGQLRYADIGNAVVLQRSTTGQWQITGFSQQIPGTHTRVPVDLGASEIGNIIDLSITGRRLTFLELSTIGGGFGVCPFGASGLFVAGALEYIS